MMASKAGDSITPVRRPSLKIIGRLAIGRTGGIEEGEGISIAMCTARSSWKHQTWRDALPSCSARASALSASPLRQKLANGLSSISVGGHATRQILQQYISGLDWGQNINSMTRDILRTYHWSNTRQTSYSWQQPDDQNTTAALLSSLKQSLCHRSKTTYV